jgi:hypothetical protein
MSNAARPFVRVYHDDLMHDYPEVWADDAALATWLRLLVLTDKMWPTPPELPRSAKGRGLAKLVDSGLVQVVSEHAFRIKGYATERAMRQQSARNAAASRWQSEGHAGRTSSTEYRSPKTNTEGTSKDAHEEKRGPRGGKVEPIADVLGRIAIGRAQ